MGEVAHRPLRAQMLLRLRCCLLSAIAFVLAFSTSAWLKLGTPRFQIPPTNSVRCSLAGCDT